MNLIRKGSSELLKVGKSISITNKLLKKIGSREVIPNDDFRVSIPDLNFQRYLMEEYNLEFIDDTVAYCKIKEISKLVVEKLSIENLEGVQYFTSLTELDCSWNLLTSLDVSKNTALISLNCGLNELISLDVSNNTALIDLVCYNTELTSLDVSKNSALTQLNCGATRLRSLDVSMNTALISLRFYSNEFISLDVSENTALIYLDCHQNQLNSIDVSKNTALIYLDCSSNQLTSLDLCNNLLLKKIILYQNPGDWWKELTKFEE